jgi:NAD(P)-dependent dehydrogenase (short-subunit alcohol dehydrogenase family)
MVREKQGMKTLGRSSTAEQALRGISLHGLRAVVTGASSGLGRETARVLALAGARVVVAARSLQSAEAAVAVLAATGLEAGALEPAALDLADLSSVRRFTEAQRATPLALLVNNAGIMAAPLGATVQGMELQLGTNHVGHFALTLGLLPALEAAPAARVVTLSSELHRRGSGARLLETLRSDPRYERRKYQPFPAYGDSKLANILFTKALARRVPAHVRTFSLHPGVIPTRLTRSLGTAGAIYRAIGSLFLKTVEQGAATTIYAATAPELDGETGAYLKDLAITSPSAEAENSELAEQVRSATVELLAR